MKIDRGSLINAIKFLKPAISKAGGEDAYNFLHVMIDGDQCQLTGSNTRIGKRVVLTKILQLDIEEAESTEPTRYEFLIDRATLEAFEMLCQKHKAKLEQHAKRDETVKIIEISPNSLYSFNRDIIYKQPSIIYPNLDDYFSCKGRDILSDQPIWELFADSAYLIDALKEFNNVVTMNFNGLNKHIYIHTDDQTYQAFFFPVKVRGDDA